MRPCRGLDAAENSFRLFRVRPVRLQKVDQGNGIEQDPAAAEIIDPIRRHHLHFISIVLPFGTVSGQRLDRARRFSYPRQITSSSTTSRSPGWQCRVSGGFLQGGRVGIFELSVAVAVYLPQILYLAAKHPFAASTIEKARNSRVCLRKLARCSSPRRPARNAGSWGRLHEQYYWL